MRSHTLITMFSYTLAIAVAGFIILFSQSFTLPVLAQFTDPQDACLSPSITCAPGETYVCIAVPWNFLPAVYYGFEMCGPDTTVPPPPPVCSGTCTSGANSCSLTSSGNMVDDGSGNCVCDAVTPDESLCTPLPPCVNAPCTCEDIGQMGVYPNCDMPVDCTFICIGMGPGGFGTCAEGTWICDTGTCDPGVGTACTANACGEAGIVQCDGTCDIPAETDVCLNDVGIQCALSECSCDPTAGNSCGTNTCGEQGTVQCDGTCSVPTETDVCLSDPGLQCSGPCGSCDPAQGSVCTPANSCNMTNSGLVQCDGSCSVSAPAEALCTPAQYSINIAADRTQVRVNEIVQLTWSAQSSAPLNCSVFGPNFSRQVSGMNGTAPSAPITAKSEFIFKCTDPTGVSVSESEIIEVIGVVEEI